MLDLVPQNGDPMDLGFEGGARLWRARGFDPAFLAHAPGAAFKPGWYRATAAIDCRSGDIEAPQLYLPTESGGFSEASSVQMAREGRTLRAEFFLAHAAQALRFDPSRKPCEFTCDGLSVEPLAARPPPVKAGPARRNLGSMAARAYQRVAQRLVPPAAAPTPLPARPPGRKERVLATIDRAGMGLEIGPSHDPIAPKREGFRVHIIDHANRQELLSKYEGHEIAHDLIEEVDFVWRGESYVELTGRPGQYDWIIGSHLIEHTPDLVGFLADCDALLRDGGVLSLAIPDKRYIFDRFRPITGLARVIDAHVRAASIPSPGAVAEHHLNAAAKGHGLGWSSGTGGDYYFIHSARETREIVEAMGTHAYHDVHNWCFVPHSFRLLVNDLYVLGYTKMREVAFHPTEGCEFYVTLGRHGKGPTMSRYEILRAIDAEVAPPDSP